MTLRFETTGSGPTKVLVTHNWMATIRSYDLARRYVDEQAFTYAFVDLRGYGLNREVPGRHTAVEAAADLIEVADALGWNEFNVVGHSMSGMIAQRVCVEAPKRVRSLVAITPVTAAGMPMDAQTKGVFTAAATQDEAWLGLADMFTSARLPKRWYAEELAAFRRDVDASGPLGYLEMLQGPAFADAMQGLTIPALAILGRHDFAAFTEEAMRATLGQWLPSLAIETIESSGHHPMLETPAYFVAVLEKFLRTVN